MLSEFEVDFENLCIDTVGFDLQGRISDYKLSRE